MHIQAPASFTCTWMRSIADNKFSTFEMRIDSLEENRIYSNITFQELEEFNQMKKRPQLKSKNHKRVFIVSYLHVWCGRLLRFSAFSRLFWAGFPL